MKVTLFTSNQTRHIYLINFLSKLCSHLFVIQENKTIFIGKNNSSFNKSKIKENYFKKVKEAEKKIFPANFIDTDKKCKFKLLPIQVGDLNKLNIKNLREFLKSDLYIVFGSSFIKGRLCNFLIKNKAINIHMGISPYYRGSSCNFWALYDNNSEFVGSTIHFLNKQIDNGKIIYHAVSEPHKNLYIYTMSTVKSAIHSLKTRVLGKKLEGIKLNKQIIRYSKQKDFTDLKIKKFYKKNIKIKKFVSDLLHNEYILKKKDFYRIY